MKLTQIFTLPVEDNKFGFPINPMHIDYTSMGVDLFQNIMLLVHQHTSEVGFYFKLYDRFTGLCFMVDLTEHLPIYKTKLEEAINDSQCIIEADSDSKDVEILKYSAILVNKIEKFQSMLDKVNREIERLKEQRVDIDPPEAEVQTLGDLLREKMNDEEDEEDVLIIYECCGNRKSLGHSIDCKETCANCYFYAVPQGPDKKLWQLPWCNNLKNVINKEHGVETKSLPRGVDTPKCKHYQYYNI